jgi:potassium inwardly-rectifying channel subfamily J
MVTIGYGVPDPYYNECYEGALVITIQSLLQYFLNALVIGAVFVRLTRPQARANTILFSDKAVIQQRDGAFYFMFQVCEAKHHDLLEAHVRCYCVRRDRKGDTKYATLPMRLQHPDDDKGAMMLTTLPQQIVHRIDHWSPLSPSWDNIEQQRRAQAGQRRQGSSSDPSSFANLSKDKVFQSAKESPLSPQPGFWGSDTWIEVPQRQIDCDQGSRDSCVCTVCGESFQSLELLRRHTEYQAAQDEASGAPAELRHRAWTLEDFQSWGWTLVEECSSRVLGGSGPGSVASASLSSGVEVALIGPSREEIQNFITQQAHIEVLVLVEGIEPTTSSTIQARHSYLFPEDVAWNMKYVDCLRPGTADRPCAVDLSFFHELMPYEPFEIGRGAHWMTMPAAVSKDIEVNI